MKVVSRMSGRHITRLMSRLDLLRRKALEQEKTFSTTLEKIHSSYRASARNFLHYLSIRQHDIRSLQAELSELGLSSLGRMEAHTLARLEAVQHILARLLKRPISRRHSKEQPKLQFL